jgi:hypothetical protein
MGDGVEKALHLGVGANERLATQTLTLTLKKLCTFEGQLGLVPGRVLVGGAGVTSLTSPQAQHEASEDRDLDRSAQPNSVLHASPNPLRAADISNPTAAHGGKR